MKRLTLLMAILASLFFISGCGQSGPLYIPGNPSQMAVPPAQESESDTASEEQDSDASSQSN